MTPQKVYLGDAVYGEWDEYGALVLTTSDGIKVTNRIVLEAEVIEALQQYLKAYGQQGYLLSKRGSAKNREFFPDRIEDITYSAIRKRPS